MAADIIPCVALVSPSYWFFASFYHHRFRWDQQRTGGFDQERRTLAGADSDAVFAFLFIDGMTDTMWGNRVMARIVTARFELDLIELE
jgi:hypothetical protein